MAGLSESSSNSSNAKVLRLLVTTLAVVNAFVPLQPAAVVKGRQQHQLEVNKYGQQHSTSLSMVASLQAPRRTLTKPKAAFGSKGTSALIEGVACAILKVALAEQNGVGCKVTSRPFDLLQGKLDAAVVDGSDWKTPMGLTARRVDLALNSMSIQFQDIFKGQINLKSPALGKAVLQLTPEDFGNFLVHPVLFDVDLPNGHFRFRREDAHIDAATSTISFKGVWYDEVVRVQVSMVERHGEFEVRLVDSARLTDLGIMTLEAELRHFFNNHSLDMDGTFVSIRDMEIVTPGKDGKAFVNVTTDVKVTRLPSPDSGMF